LTGVYDDFEFGDRLGEGNYAIVFRATDNETGAVVAIKSIVKEKLIRSSQGANILVNEIHCMRCLDHKNIIKLHRVYEEDEKVFLILEYVEGGDLFNKIIAAEHFTERYCAVVARKLLSALVYMHDQNIIHRDLKLENIMMTSIDEESDVKIADFGFAAEMTPENMSIFCGSPGYVAPEILKKLPYDAKVDVYGVGIIIYIVLSGNSPFFGRSVEETLDKNREGMILYEPHFWSDISESAQEFVQYLTRLDPTGRPTAAEALRHKWIQQHNRQYFDSLDSSVKRPSFSKRRGAKANTGMTATRSPGLPKRSLPETTADGRRKTVDPSLAMYLATPPGGALEETLPIREAKSPVQSTEAPKSPAMAKSPGSKGWKPIKPHP
jgi:serine/threonine protein kinase